MDANSEIFKAVLDDTGFDEDLKNVYRRNLYDAVRGRPER